MSGGSWDYCFSTLGEIAGRLLSEESVKRRALGLLLDKIAKAMKAIEWNDSGDGDDREDALIDAVIGAQLINELAVDTLARVQAQVDDLRELIKGGKEMGGAR